MQPDLVHRKVQIKINCSIRIIGTVNFACFNITREPLYMYTSILEKQEKQEIYFKANSIQRSVVTMDIIDIREID